MDAHITKNNPKHRVPFVQLSSKVTAQSGTQGQELLLAQLDMWSWSHVLDFHMQLHELDVM